MTLQLHRCKLCGTRWLLWPDALHGGGWNLLDQYQRPGACCDNVAMGDQIEYLRDFDLNAALLASHAETIHQLQQELQRRDEIAANQKADVDRVAKEVLVECLQELTVEDQLRDQVADLRARLALAEQENKDLRTRVGPPVDSAVDGDLPQSGSGEKSA